MIVFDFAHFVNLVCTKVFEKVPIRHMCSLKTVVMKRKLSKDVFRLEQFFLGVSTWNN